MRASSRAPSSSESVSKSHSATTLGGSPTGTTPSSVARVTGCVTATKATRAVVASATAWTTVSRSRSVE